jgi:3',5'-cyclic AMP phosphodiesterase CpdA
MLSASPQEENAMSVQIVHLSDLHFDDKPDSWNDNDWALNNAGARFEALAKFIDNEYPKAHIAITGDITDSGTIAQYQLAQRLLGPWLESGKLSVVPGNHDCGTYGLHFNEERWTTFYRTFGTAVGRSSTLPWVKHVGPVALIGLDSTKASKGTGWACGAVGGTQLQRLGEVLENPAVMGRVPVVLMHHHPFDKADTTLLADAPEFRRILQRGLQRRRKAVVLYGHRHGTKRHSQSCVTYVEAPSSIAPQGDDERLVFRVLYVSENQSLKIESRRMALPSHLK